MATKAEAERTLEAAKAALARGDRLLHVILEVGGLTGAASSWGSSGNAVEHDSNIGWLLGEIEALGWRLEQSSLVFVGTGGTSSPGFASEGLVSRGVLMGQYVFRRIADDATDAATLG
ncbi:hypothetical protein [Homoserinibacter sp. YIM 151385]|uniref:hypothetical protein n=1 Tax=Homoserinibacter sp. YIM 151385 TaxID=2985506 RepID=UPI0022F10D75|nr:hypothetical protein [Homoserinibacter sp. YIM 151385]WBU38204.1 hypothetical protein OF852_01070 [Homoserinibacter sp. YIM 151385]